MRAGFDDDATSKELAKAFGAVVRKLREQKGISQDSFAFDCGINRSYYGHIERGRYSPTLYTVHRIAVGLGISVSDLMQVVEKEWSLTKRS